MAKNIDFIIIGCWLVFFVYWLVSALKVKAIVEKQSLASALQHRIPVGLSWCLLAFHKFPPPLNHSLTPRTTGAEIIGAAICVLGLCVTIWARRTLAGNWSSDVTFKQNHELVIAGPYRFVRHPIYTGLLIMCLGSAVDITCLRGWLALAVMFTGFWIKLKQEEKLLLRHFPDTYPAYQKRVKALVPFVI
ncbi:MAG TPA: isoprenylcysteine carboxylmethyltransferase family protein [Candidatus Binatia bacterium]|nr:isoprenylcysteine carboxylmethyltransferase family protein [Candidatus Binatia bacterium]